MCRAGLSQIRMDIIWTLGRVIWRQFQNVTKFVCKCCNVLVTDNCFHYQITKLHENYILSILWGLLLHAVAYKESGRGNTICIVLFVRFCFCFFEGHFYHEPFGFSAQFIVTGGHRQGEPCASHTVFGMDCIRCTVKIKNDSSYIQFIIMHPSGGI